LTVVPSSLVASPVPIVFSMITIGYVQLRLVRLESYSLDDMAPAATGGRTPRCAGPSHLQGADVKDPAIADAVARVRDADAIVIGTPVYKASFNGVLKAFLDLMPQDGLASPSGTTICSV
jgi:hypothetical protein